MQKLFKATLLSLLLLTTAYAAEDKNTQPVMSMTDIQGKTYKVQGTEQGLNIEGLEGKVVFLEFFGHKCPPCLKSIPHLIELQEKHKDNLAIVSIEVQGYGNENTAKFAKSKGMNYIVLSEEKASEVVNYIQQRAQWRGSIPFLVAMDTKGDVQFVQAGMIPEASLEELIEQLSDKKSTNTPTTIEKVPSK
ncbi:MAG: thioredoxin family protein [uncultured Sulfurovum sp.]|uniref:Thioredoxin family protein n=1 Tax=uncultured Sulfurovum sp. TaxID=269237 RepID=A0A6S6S7J0_9BACT|nr:MAG: thioredoxin family protein [uncultured Sulfurovum sp.]